MCCTVNVNFGRECSEECSPSDLQAEDYDLPGGSEVVMTGKPSNNSLQVMAMILT